MKKNNISHRLFLAFLAVTLPVFFTGASIWEGAAAVSSGGDLPETGFYAATNSFPRNTVIDITNLENGKTVRVIVAATLDSPGLLAVLSKEGAGAIGLQSRSIGRIRMIQPSDPIAYSRFGEENLRSGDPDFDPEAALKAYGSGITDSAEAAGGSKTAEPPALAAGKPASAAEKPPAQTGASTEPKIAAKEPSSGAAAVLPPKETPAEIKEEKTPEIAGNEDYREDSPHDYGESAWTDDDYGYGEAGSASGARTDEGNLPPETAWFIPDPGAERFPENKGQTQNGTKPQSDLFLVPSEARPPETTDSYPDSRYFVDPISKAPPQGPDTAVSSIPPAPALSIFGVPELGELEAGKYYLQIGAYSKTGAVENEINKIGKAYPLAVQRAVETDGRPVLVNGDPVYRILVGPVNHGESGALLQRFKGQGYTKAFIRKGGK